MNVDLEFLRKTVNARQDIVRWLNERPNVGLNVTDIAALVDGYDYLAKIIKDLTGQDPVEEVLKLEEPTINITYGE